MCTSIVKIIEAAGAGKSSEGWFPLTHAVVCYDHPHYAQLEDAILIDFSHQERSPGTRSAVELSLESAKALHAALAEVIAQAEVEEAEHRGVQPGPVPLFHVRAA